MFIDIISNYLLYVLSLVPYLEQGIFYVRINDYTNWWIYSMSNEDIILSKEQFKAALPAAVRKRVTDGTVDAINELLENPDTRDHFRDNLLSYGSVMAEGKYKIDSYINAVKYVSYKMLGSSNTESYAKTFPERYQRLVNENASIRDIGSYASAYNKSQLVNKVFEQTLVPTHILNADVFQKAINVQANLMLRAKSEKVRSDAANSLLTHLKRPEAQKVELSVSTSENDSIKELRKSTMDLVAQQRKMIESGMMNAKEVAHSDIIEGEVVE